MHPSVMEFLHATVHDYDLDESKPVVEIGSYNVNGSARAAWPDGTPWTGYDVVAGPGVDVVCSAHDLPIEDDSAPVVVSVECFEHDPWPNASFSEIRRIVAPGGIVIVTTRAPGMDYHHPPHHWGYSRGDMERLASYPIVGAGPPYAEALDPVTEPAPPIKGRQAPLTILSLEPDPSPIHPGWFLVARA